MRLLSCRIEYQPGVACKSVAYKKECNVIFQSWKHEEITFPFPHEFTVVFIPYIIGTIFF